MEALKAFLSLSFPRVFLERTLSQMNYGAQLLELIGAKKGQLSLDWDSGLNYEQFLGN